MACTHDRHNLFARSILDFACEELVTFVNQHLLDFGERLSEILHHGAQGILLLYLGQVFFADFGLVENACDESAQEAQLAVPGRACPSALKGNLDIAVGKHQFGILFGGDIDRFLEF